MAMSSTVQGPTPGSRASSPRASCQSTPGSRHGVARRPGPRPARPPCGAARGHGERRGQLVGVGAREGRDGGPRAAQAAVRVPTGSPKASRSRPAQAGRSSEAHLLAEHDPDGELVLVDGAGHPAPGCLGDPRGELGVGAEGLVDGYGIGVEVEQAAAAGDGELQVAVVGERSWAGDVVGGRGEGDDAGATGQAEGPPVGAVRRPPRPRPRRWRPGGRRGCPAAAAAGTGGAARGRRATWRHRGDGSGPGPAARRGWSRTPRGRCR